MCAARGRRALLGLGLALAAPLVLAGPSAAPFAPREALVIGNAHYGRGPLRNALNDARQMDAALRDLGFSSQVLEDADWDTTVRALRAFVDRTQRSHVRLIYYAGHGLQVHGHNYLQPIGPEPANERELRARSIDVDELIEQFSQQQSEGVTIFIVDACRRNPFAGVLKPLRGAESSGLAPTRAPRGMVVAFSTGPNGAALDGGTDGYGVYTRHLLEQMQVPGLALEPLFKRVHTAVEQETQRAQRPWLSTSMTGEFCFRPTNDNRCGTP